MVYYDEDDLYDIEEANRFTRAYARAKSWKRNEGHMMLGRAKYKVQRKLDQLKGFGQRVGGGAKRAGGFVGRQGKRVGGALGRAGGAVGRAGKRAGGWAIDKAGYGYGYAKGFAGRHKLGVGIAGGLGAAVGAAMLARAIKRRRAARQSAGQ